MKRTCPICKGEYGRTYEEHTGSEKHRAAVRKATGREQERLSLTVQNRQQRAAILGGL